MEHSVWDITLATTFVYNTRDTRDTGTQYGPVMPDKNIDIINSFTHNVENKIKYTIKCAINNANI